MKNQEKNNNTYPYLTIVTVHYFYNDRSTIERQSSKELPQFKCKTELTSQKTFLNSTVNSEKIHNKFNIVKSYETSFSNDTLRSDQDNDGPISRRLPRSKEAKLGDIKHHVFILKLYSKKNLLYRAYCGGSIITDVRVLSSAQCFYTNRKNLRYELSKLKIAGGLLTTVQSLIGAPTDQQWRTPKKVYTQKFYRFPAYSLAVVEVDTPWSFNNHVNKIPFARITLDYDGVCMGTVVRITKSWAFKKYLFTEQHKIVPRHKCERSLLRTCRLYICTIAEAAKAETAAVGSGLVCFDTGTKEEDPVAGLLVGVTVLVNSGLPSLNHRIAMFQQWVQDGTTHPKILRLLILTCLMLIKFMR